MADNNERELGWEDEISNDSGDFIILPAGVYPFTVTKFERGRSSGSEKLQSCNMAIISLKITAPDGRNITITDNLILHSRLEWKLSSFFRSIGLKKHDEPLKMRWNEVTGKTGKLKLKIEKWTGRDGGEYESNKVYSYLDPDDNTSVAAPASQKSFW